MTMDSQPEEERSVTSGPIPGPAPVRPIWDGEKATLPPVYSPPPEPTAPRWNKDLAFGPARNPRRITGLDAARGVALLGMVAVHILPAYNEYTGHPTFVWQACAGRAAALFAVLTGVTIALLTGASYPHTGRRLNRSRVALATRAVVILLLGLAIDQLDLPVYNILPYYGLMFLFAIPLVTLRIRSLLLVTAALAVIGPLVVFFTNSRIDFTTTLNPNFTSLFTLPTDTLLTLFVGGTYPLATWMTYIVAGMVIGRLKLRWLLTQARLIVFGAVVSVVAGFASTVLIDYSGGFANLYYNTDGYDVGDIVDVIDYGPEGHMPTNTLWWLAVNGPHTGTTFDLLTCTGLAILIIGSMLVISRTLNELLYPLIAAGSMTLTLYTVHLLLFSFFGDSIENAPIIWFIVQVAAALLGAAAWQLIVEKGPLESMVSKFCRFVSRTLIPDPPEPVTIEGK